MNNIQYFLNVAIRSCRRDKLYYRPWKQLMTIILLEIECIMLTGRTLNEL